MIIAIRVDSSRVLGSGHLMRCLTLAHKLRERNAEVIFVSRLHPGNMVPFTEKEGFQVRSLPGVECMAAPEPSWNDREYPFGVGWNADAAQTAVELGEIAPVDWLVVDHYSLDARWEREIRQVAKRVMVIDDLADRSHDCDVLLDQNYHDETRDRYARLVPAGTRIFLGPRYSLLRSEFIRVQKSPRFRDGRVRRILVFFGGCDAGNETAKAIAAIKSLGRHDIDVDVIVGNENPNKETVEESCSTDSRFHYHCQVDDMASRMRDADLAIGAGGTSTWERCYLGVPSITVVVAQNQAETTAAVARGGATVNLGDCRSVTVSDIHRTLEGLLSDPSALRAMAVRARALMGHGIHDGPDEIVRVMLGDGNAAA